MKLEKLFNGKIGSAFFLGGIGIAVMAAQNNSIPLDTNPEHLKRLVAPFLVGSIFASIVMYLVQARHQVLLDLLEVEKSEKIRLENAIQEKTSELRESQQTFKDYAEMSADWFWETDENLRFSKFSGGMFKHLGFDKRFFIGKTRRELLAEKGIDSPQVKSHLDDLDAHRAFEGFVYQYQTPDGSERYASVSGIPRFDDQDRFRGYRGTTTDVTDRILTERKLIESEQRFRDYADSSAEWFWEMDSDLCFTEITGQHELSKSGIKKSIIGKTRCETASDQEDPQDQKWQAHLADLKEHKPFKGFEFQLKSEGAIWVSVSGIPLFASSGLFRGYRGSGVNITERKRMEADLIDTKEESEAANRAKSEFLAAMSHDLRTPLNAIMGFSDMMRMKAFGALGHEKYEEYADDIHNSGSLLISLINDVLDLSKVESGKYELHEETLNILTIVNSSVKQTSQMVKSSDLELHVEVQPDFPDLYGDERALLQVLNNLLSNAIKFTAENGTITAAASLDTMGRIIISVQDTGIGMTRDGIAKALRPFEQADSSHSRKHEGTGLGLHLCSNFMNLFGGELDIESDSAVGTKVTLRFPAERTIKKSDDPSD